MPQERQPVGKATQPLPWLDTRPFSGSQFFGYHQKEVIRLAPDCVVYINGQFLMPICQKCGRKKDLRNDVISVSVSNDIGGSPTSASITISAPRHEEDRFFVNGHLIFSAMQEVRIYMKGRYLVDGKPRYYPVFWGMVSGPGDNYSPGSGTVTLECVSMLRWWEIMKVVIQPSAIHQDFSGVNPSVWTTRFANKTPFQIIYALTEISMANTQAPNDMSNLNVITETKAEWRQRNEDLIAYWNLRFKELSNALVIYGVDGNPIALDNSGPNSRKENDLRLGKQSQFYRIPALQDSTGKLEDAGPFSGIYQGDFMETEMKAHLEIANEVKEFNGFEFFQQMDGHLIFKPPFFNLDPRQNFPVSWIEDKEIVSWNLGESEKEVISRVEVKGSLMTAQEKGDEVQPTGYYQDYKLCAKYGVRVAESSMLYLRNPQQCRVYATSEISRHNTKVFAASITIVGRPEVLLGFPVFLPARDAFFYVTGISHEFSFSGPFQTTLTLEAKRPKRYDGKGLVIKNGAYVFVSKDPKLTAHLEDAHMTAEERKLDDEKKVYAREGPEQGTWEEKSGVPATQATEKTIPITDEEGYEVIGGFPYGRTLAVEDGKLVPKKGAATAAWFSSWVISISKEVEVKDSSDGDPAKKPTLGFQATIGGQTKTLEQWQDTAKTVDPAQLNQYLNQTVGLRGVGNVGKALADISPKGDEVSNPNCTCQGSYNFSEYLKNVLAGVTQPSSADLQQAIVTNAATSVGLRRNLAMQSLDTEIQKDSNYVQGVNDRLMNTVGLSPAQIQNLKQDRAQVEARIRTYQAALKTLQGKPLDKPLSQAEVETLLGGQ